MIQPKRRALKAPESVCVLIATYRRKDALLRCLRCLETQSRVPDEVLVIVRTDDFDTAEMLRGLSTSLVIKTVPVAVPGAVAARNAGLDVVTTDIIAIIDDDTAPCPEWLQTVMHDFAADASLGGLGGRDRCFGPDGFNDAREPVVGKITWAGNVIGNHHLGFGGLREVDALKGANMSFRAEAVAQVRFDPRLKGTGAQPGEDVCFTVAVRNEGWKIAYDPAAMIEHFPEIREDARHYVGVSALTETQPYWDFSYNQVLMVWYALSPLRRIAFFFWSCAIGSGIFPGFVQAVRFTPKLGRQSWQRFFIAQSAKFVAIRDLLSESRNLSPRS